jgi:hypothetical protein
MQLFFAEVFIDGTALNQELRYPCGPVICGFFEMKSFAVPNCKAQMAVYFLAKL